MHRVGINLMKKARLSSTPSSSSSLKPLATRVTTELNIGGAAKVWAEITELARQPNIVADLGQGFPDFEGSAVARKRASEVALDSSLSRLNQYSLINGTMDLRVSLCNFMNKTYGDNLDPVKHAFITTSGTESLYCGIASILNPNDDVIIFDPSFPWYGPQIRLMGGNVKNIKLDWPKFKMDFAKVEEILKLGKTKFIILNTPHNPTGHVFSKEEMTEIAKLCVKYNVYVISDEVYEFFVFKKGAKHYRICDFPGMAERVITCGSASKMFSLTGWRVGWVYSKNESLITASKAYHSYTSYCAPTLLQEAVRKALDETKPADLDFHYFLENADKLGKALKKRFPELKYELPDGGYFLVVSVKDCKLKPSSGGNESPIINTDVTFCKHLASQFGIVGVPMRVFYNNNQLDDGLVRFAICKNPQTIERAIGKLLLQN